MTVELDKLPEGIKRIWRDVDRMVGDFLCIETDDGMLIRIEAMNLSGSTCSINILPYKSEDYHLGFDEDQVDAVFCSANKPSEFFSARLGYFGTNNKSSEE